MQMQDKQTYSPKEFFHDKTFVDYKNNIHWNPSEIEKLKSKNFLFWMGETDLISMQPVFPFGIGTIIDGIEVKAGDQVLLTQPYKYGVITFYPGRYSASNELWWKNYESFNMLGTHVQYGIEHSNKVFVYTDR